MRWGALGTTYPSNVAEERASTFLSPEPYLSQPLVHPQPRFWGQPGPMARSQREVLEGSREITAGAVLGIHSIVCLSR